MLLPLLNLMPGLMPVADILHEAHTPFHMPCLPVPLSSQPWCMLGPSGEVIAILLCWSDKIEVQQQGGTPRLQAEVLTELLYLYRV